MAAAPSSRDSVNDPCTGPLFACDEGAKHIAAHNGEPPAPATVLSETRIYVDRHRLALAAMIDANDPRSGGEALAKRHACIVDGIVRALFAAGRCRLEQRKGRGLGTIAFGGVGSYGRGLVALGSGHAVRIVYDANGRREDAISLAIAALEPVRSCGVAMDVQVISLDDFIAKARGDLDAALSVLDFRHVAGEQAVSDRLSDAIRATLAADSARNLLLEALAAERHARHGRMLREAWFDVRDSAGGLRDLDVLGWIARATIAGRCLGGLVQAGAWTGETHVDVVAARDLLWRVRNRLHLGTGKRDDRLDVSRARDLAPGLGYASADELLANLATACAHVSEATSQLFDWAKTKGVPDARQTDPASLRRFG